MGETLTLGLKQHILSGWRRLRKHKLIVNAGAYVSGSFLQKAASFLLLPLWANFLTPEDYGITGTLTAYSGMLSTLLGLGLYGAVVRDYYDYTGDLERRKQYITSVIIFQILFAGSIIASLFLFGRPLWEKYTTNIIPFSPYVQLTLLTIYADLLAQIPLALYRARQQARKFVYFQYGKFFFTALFNMILIVKLQWGAYGVLMGSLIASIVITILSLYFAYKDWFYPQISWCYVRKALAFGLPLVPHAVAAWVLKSVDRLVLERYVSLEKIGLYNLGYTFGLAMQYLVTGINQAWSPYYYKLMDSKKPPESKIIQVVSLYLVLVGGVCLLGILFVGEAVHLLLPERYYEAVPYIPPIFLGYQMLGLYYFAGMPLFYFKKTKLLPVLTVTAGVFTLVLNLIFVPTYGALAAAWITAASYGLLFVLVHLISHRLQKIEYPLLKYGCLLSILISATVITPYLEIFNVTAIIIKLIIVLLFAGLSYLLLVRQYFNKIDIFDRVRI